MRRRRRRKIGSDDDDDDSFDETENSDKENSDNDQSDISDDDFIEDSDENDSECEDMIIEETKEVITTNQMMKCYQNHPMIESFFLCVHWLMNSREIIDQCKENTAILWNRLAKLINVLSVENEAFENDLEAKEFDAEAMKKMAFPEDKMARGMKIFEKRHRNLDFEPSIQFKSDQIVSTTLSNKKNPHVPM